MFTIVCGVCFTSAVEALVHGKGNLHIRLIHLHVATACHGWLGIEKDSDDQDQYFHNINVVLKRVCENCQINDFSSNHMSAHSSTKILWLIL